MQVEDAELALEPDPSLQSVPMVLSNKTRLMCDYCATSIATFLR